jgi:L-ascorbate metabolism protein UlaG (beta-lactamase superfamily)
MKIIWLGHSGFRIEIAGQVLLVDPWLTGNPMFPEGRRDEAIAGATGVLLTHGHGDHSGDAVQIARDLGIPVAGIYDLMSHWEASEGIATVGFNKGGTVTFGEVAVTMVNAVHSSSVGTDHGPMYAGAEAGFMIRGEGHTIYVTGDTDIMADMAWMGEYHAPDIGILCAGGHFTMDMKAAAWAAKKYFDFKLVIPCHYRTFPLLAQDAEELKAGLPGVEVREPEVLVEIEV